MPRKRWLALFALVLSLGLLVGACGGDDGGGDGADTAAEPGQEEEGEPQAGGTFRVNAESFEWTSNSDPTGEYLGTAFGLYSNMLVRTLLVYRHV